VKKQVFTSHRCAWTMQEGWTVVKRGQVRQAVGTSGSSLVCASSQRASALGREGRTQREYGDPLRGAIFITLCTARKFQGLKYMCTRYALSRACVSPQ